MNVSAWIFDWLWRQIITRKMVKGTLRNQVFVQVHLTLVFPITPQTDGLRQRDVRQICVVIPWSSGNSLGFFSIVKNGQNKSWIRAHVHCAPEQGVVETGEVKGYVVCKEMHTSGCTVRYCSNPWQLFFICSMMTVFVTLQVEKTCLKRKKTKKNPNTPSADAHVQVCREQEAARHIHAQVKTKQNKTYHASHT